MKRDLKKSCLNCKFYRMIPSERRDRTASDLCLKKGSLPAAYTSDNLCCGGGGGTFWGALSRLEEIAEKCESYEERKL